MKLHEHGTPTSVFPALERRQSGPFSVPAIREMLNAGDISRMHQINYNNRWMVLDEFLEKHALAIQRRSVGRKSRNERRS
ncbi:MAG: hypothetical protein WDN28_02710 [Chthoniobacter sp.]